MREKNGIDLNLSYVFNIVNLRHRVRERSLTGLHRLLRGLNTKTLA